MRLPSLEHDFWRLRSGEQSQQEHPDTFRMPPPDQRQNLKRGQAALLIFEIEGQDEQGVVQVQGERMWVIVSERIGDVYVGILDNQPASLGGGATAMSPRYPTEGSMRQPRVRFPIWRWMAIVAMVACSAGAVLALSAESHTAGHIFTGWGALYGAPAMLILARGISLATAAKIVGRTVAYGLPLAGLYGMICFAMSGYVGLFGGFMLAALIIGWVALLTAALTGEKAVSLES